MLDTVHRGGNAFITALGISTSGQKMVLGYWEGATENSDICNELFSDLERRNLRITPQIIFVTDGGKGIIKSLRDKFGKKFVHQRCTIHKDHNLQKHVAKKYRNKIHAEFKRALAHTKHDDAKRALEALEKELEGLNASAAKTLHRLEAR